VPWLVEFHDDFEPEFLAFEPAVQDALLVVAKLLADFGPQLGRPCADTLNGSEHANIEELRFEASDGEWRAAFTFDPQRQAILLVAGTNLAAARGASTGNSSQKRISGFLHTWIA
jgi:hypothetical protein